MQILYLQLLPWCFVDINFFFFLRLMSNSSVITDGSGNYSTDTQCTWLIDSGHVNTSIRLHLDHFATECSWDHLYVFDGDSIYDPLLAVFRWVCKWWWCEMNYFSMLWFIYFPPFWFNASSSINNSFMHVLPHPLSPPIWQNHLKVTQKL